MSTPSRFQRWTRPLLAGRLGQAEVQEPDPDPADPIDYAHVDLAGAVQVAIDIGTVALVQDVDSGIAGVASSSVTATLASAPEEGHTLIAVLSYRGTSTSHSDPSGWTKHADVQGPAFDGGRMIMYSKVAGAATSASLTIGSSAMKKQLYLAEWSGLGAFDLDAELDNQGATTSMTTSSLAPTTSGGVLFAGFNQSARNPTLAVQSPFTEDHDVDIDASGPSTAFGHQIVGSFAGSYTANCTSSASEGWGGFIASFGTEDAVWTAGPGANDGDDATYAESDAEIDSASARIALDVERLIYRCELRIGCASSGSTTYEIYGSDDAEFTSPVLLASVTFTATGSFTAQEVVMTWLPAASYAYYQLQGTDSSRRFYDINLYSLIDAGGVTDHPQLTGRSDADQHPADAVSFDPAATPLVATDLQAGLEEVALLGTISPSQLVANTDNWSPTGLATADVIRVSTDASRNLTGIVAPALSRRVILQNIGSFDLVLVHDATSTAANRFYCPSSTNMTLAANASVEIVYDETSDRWRVLDPAAGSGAIDWGETADIVTQDYDDTPDGGALNEAARADHRHGMPSESAGSGTVASLVKAYASTKYTAGDLTMSHDNSWGDVGISDLTLAAATGDVLEIGVNLFCGNTTAVSLCFDAATIVSAAVVNHTATGAAPNNSQEGWEGWRIQANAVGKASGSIFYTLQSGDISAGTVTLRLRCNVLGTTNRVINATTNQPIQFTAQNLGQSGTISGIEVSASPSLSTEGAAGFDTDDEVLYVYDGQRARAASEVGWVAYARHEAEQGTNTVTSLTIATNGGTLLVPIHLAGHMLLESVSISQTSTASAREWGWDLYLQDLNNGNSGENTLRRVAESNGNDAFTPVAASIRTLAATSAPVYLGPGTYWLAVQCTHATNALDVAKYDAGSSIVNSGQTKTTTNPNGSTLDAVAATWTKQNDRYLVALRGRVFGQTTAF